MKIEAQVTSLELSKKLKELGVKQESLWNWWKAGHIFVEEERYAGRQWEKLASAFSVAELGEMLPEWIHSKLNSSVGGKKFACIAVEKHLRKPVRFHEFFEADTEADARAKMLIYLIEHNLLERHANQQTKQG